jgi:MoaA/NifB/PqqE/SkfB family radical SAM enzyme
VQGNKREIYGNKTTDEVKKLLDEAIKDSDSIVFTGGEPTIRKDIVELTSYAKRLGFRKIQIQTNGRMLAYRKLCEELISAGANEFSPALHGHTSELHDYLTRSKGSFKQTVAAIQILKSLRMPIITNTVVVRSNYLHLVEIAQVLTDLDVDQYQFAFVHPLGTAAEYFFSIVPRMKLIEPFIKKGLDVGINKHKRVMTEAIPYCFMEGYEKYVAERIIPRTKIFEGHLTIDDYTEHRLTEGKLKGEKCRECVFYKVCEGPWREYPEHYGWDEFEPRKGTKAEKALNALL